MGPRFITTEQETQNKLGNETPEEPEGVRVNRFFFGRRVKRSDAKSDISVPTDVLPSGVSAVEIIPMYDADTDTKGPVERQCLTCGAIVPSDSDECPRCRSRSSVEEVSL